MYTLTVNVRDGHQITAHTLSQVREVALKVTRTSTIMRCFYWSNVLRAHSEKLQWFLKQSKLNGVTNFNREEQGGTEKQQWPEKRKAVATGSLVTFLL